jgi:hypothetical protein
LLREHGAPDDRHERADDHDRRDERESDRNDVAHHERPDLLHVVRAVHALHHRVDTASRRPQGRDRADAHEIRTRRREKVLELGTDRIRDRGRQVVAQRANRRVRGVVDAEVDRHEGSEGGHEQPEREHREQEAIRDLGGQTGNVVLHHAVYETVA